MIVFKRLSMNALQGGLGFWILYVAGSRQKNIIVTFQVVTGGCHEIIDAASFFSQLGDGVVAPIEPK